jgi:hypothetical protein
VRWVRLATSNNEQQVKICAEPAGDWLNFSVHRFPVQQLDAAKHTCDLHADPQRHYVYLDSCMLGVGGVCVVK